MSGNDLVPGKPGRLTSLIEGGALGAVLGKPTADAIGRLVGGLTDIPAAGLENIAQRIRDDTEARSEVSRALAKAAAQRAVADPAIVDRATMRWANQRLRQQENIEAVAAKAVEYMQEDPPVADSPGPSIDFMNYFETSAERASSDDMRDLFARILAGECRKPGSFSLGALQTLSVMDQQLARAVTAVRSWVIDDEFILFSGAFTKGPLLNTIYLLVDFGLLRVGMLQRDGTIGPEGGFGFAVGSKAFVVRGEPNSVFKLDVALLTPVGGQIMSLVTPEPDPEGLLLIGERLKATRGVTRVQLGDVVGRTGGLLHYTNLRDV